MPNDTRVTNLLSELDARIEYESEENGSGNMTVSETSYYRTGFEHGVRENDVLDGSTSVLCPRSHHANQPGKSILFSLHMFYILELNYRNCCLYVIVWKS